MPAITWKLLVLHSFFGGQAQVICNFLMGM